ncbi:MAG: PhzF family phenazine biosynthesis protein [Gloeocapsa sp. DLM2.Bin57]|nr:MAG: PhzF family phenazine biosynthesis protein [Gloeocapsa sp. DLM2.Bin57]
MTRTYNYYTIDVFTQQIFGGNPLAVFPDAQGLTTSQMQQIAREFNLSETVFVLPPEKPIHTHRLRIFTPFAELPFAGHPTLGTAYLLSRIKPTSSLVFEEGVGTIRVKIEPETGYTELTSTTTPEYQKTLPETRDLAQILNINPADILDIAAVSCGLPFLFIHLTNLEVIGQVKLNLPLWEQILSCYWSPHLYLFTRETVAKEADIHARMFAPALGISEDPATGSGATALAAYLVKDNLHSSGTLEWIIEQGLEMGRPSLLKASADCQDSQLYSIRVGGNSVLVSEGRIFL